MDKINDGRRITQYVSGDFIVTIIVIPSNMYMAWLCHKNGGIMQFMFGTPIRTCTEKEFVDMVEGNLDDYIEGYKADMEEDTL